MAIRAAEEAAMAARRVAREATETWLKAFTEAIGKVQLGEVVVVEPEPVTEGEVVDMINEPGEGVPSLLQETGKTKETNAEKPKETKKIIESRLEFLTRMYATKEEESKDRADENEDENE